MADTVVLKEDFLAKIAGWEAMKTARALLATGKVLSSNWTPPVLRGVVQDADASLRAGLVIKNAIDIDNICPCRVSRQFGQICAHSVAVGLHALRPVTTTPLPSAQSPAKSSGPQKGPATAQSSSSSSSSASNSRRLVRAAGPGQGKPVSLHLILPPNFADAVARNKIMVCLEAGRDSGRIPLGAFPRGDAASLNAQDTMVLDRLEEWAGGETPGMIMVTAPQFDLLLGLLAGHPGVTLGRSQNLEITSEEARLHLQAALEPNGEIRVRLTRPPAKLLLTGGKRAWTFEDSRLAPITVPETLKNIWTTGSIRVPRIEVPLFLSRDWPALARHHLDAGFTPDDFFLVTRPARVELQLKGGLAELEGILRFHYQGIVVQAGSTAAPPVWFPDETDPKRYATRDLAGEQAALGRLLQAGFAPPDGEGRVRLRGQENVLNFFARLHPRLAAEWDVRLEERLQASRDRNMETVSPQFRVLSSGQNWFDLEVSYQTGAGEKFEPSEIQKLLRSGQSHARMRNGKFALLDTGAVEQFQEVLTDCRPNQTGTAYRIPMDQAPFLTGSVAAQPGWKIEGNTAWRDTVNRLDPDKAAPPDLGPLESVLRPYQKKGVAWLQWLRQSNFGGILADEMGLGKTLQTLAFLENARRLAPAGSLKPALIVCPTSLVCNWIAEAAKFTPTLRSLDLTGSGRAERFPLALSHDLLVTSYALIRRDLEFYRGLELDTVVLDEAQHIKNRQTQNAQAVKSLRAARRLVLTGTPMENSVQDLWSIFDFLMPGYLGSSADFTTRYEAPIIKENDAGTRTRLARRLRPFLLRRLKKDVAADLPARIEQVAFCDLSDDQRALYQRLLQAARAEVTEAVGENGFNKSRMMIFTALLRLRQICCDPRLLKLPDSPFTGPSPKMELFGELLEEAIDGGHRVLVFSQFVQMLQLLKEWLQKENVEFCYLDGSTQNRGEVVQRFQSNDKIPVFLISLKAGGTGLNLTGADTVVHFDPWWNPAVEDQATDRAHRIGQTRVVTSYKLIARGTVEEKIVQLQAKKKAVIQGVIDGEESFAGSLNWDEVQELLQDR